jgi:hypothetical protein
MDKYKAAVQYAIRHLEAAISMDSDTPMDHDVLATLQKLLQSNVLVVELSSPSGHKTDKEVLIDFEDVLAGHEESLYDELGLSCDECHVTAMATIGDVHYDLAAYDKQEDQESLTGE